MVLLARILQHTSKPSISWQHDVQDHGIKAPLVDRCQAARSRGLLCHLDRGVTKVLCDHGRQWLVAFEDQDVVADAVVLAS